MKRTDFLQLLKENNQAAIQLAITNALEQNENLNLYDDVTEFTHTPLLDAVTEGCDAAVTLLLETKKVLVDGNGWGYSPLMIASGKGFTSIVQKLLAHQANLNYEVEWCQTSARQIQIIRTNNTYIEIGRYNMLKEYKYCAVDTSETLAIRHGHLDTLKALLALRNGQFNFDDNSLLCIAAEDDQLAIMHYLISLGFSPQKLNAKKETPLLLATRYACFEIVEFLLTQKPDQKDIHLCLKSAIDRQDISDHLEIIELLMTADTLIKEPIQEQGKSSKKTLMDYAASRVEMPFPLTGGFSNFAAIMFPDMSLILQKMTVVCMLFEAEVPRTEKACASFSDGTQFEEMKQTHEALLKKGLHAKDIAKQIFEKYWETMPQADSSSSAKTTYEEKTMQATQRFEALLKAAKPADMEEKPFGSIIAPLFTFFETKKASVAHRQEKASRPSQTPQTLFLRTLKEEGLLWSKPETGLVTKETTLNM